MSSPKKTWTVLEVLRWTTANFQEKKVSDPRASAEVLLAHTLEVTRLDLYLRHDQPMNPEELARFKALVRRRARGEPVAYLTGHKEFWSLDFTVTPATLIPRPETEVLVEAVIEVVGEGAKGRRPLPPPPQPLPQSLMVEGASSPLTTISGLGGGCGGRAGTSGPWPSPHHHPLALEVGVGSGAVVVALVRELPHFRWVGVDISAAALQVARENARRHEVLERVWLVRGNLLDGLKPAPRFALVAANLPYVSKGEWEGLPRDIRDFEPQEALLGGADGLAWLRPLAGEAHLFLEPGGWLALEVGQGQAPVLKDILQATVAYERVDVVRDYSGVDRVVRARRRSPA